MRNRRRSSPIRDTSKVTDGQTTRIRKEWRRRRRTIYVFQEEGDDFCDARDTLQGPMFVNRGEGDTGAQWERDQKEKTWTTTNGPRFKDGIPRGQLTGGGGRLPP